MMIVPMKYMLLLLALLFTSCMVVPQSSLDKRAECALSTDKKHLKVVNLLDGDTTFYAWEDEMLSIVTMPSSAIISSVYVAVNNVYHFGEKQIKCN